MSTMPWLSDSLLSLEELQRLPEADGSGVYFLWNGSQLQYIGQSRSISSRITQHVQNRRFGHLRLRRVPRIKFDRHTSIILDTRQFIGSDELDALQERLVRLEAIYIAKYRTPFNR